MAKGYEVFVDDKGGEKIVLANGQELSVGVYEGVVRGAYSHLPAYVVNTSALAQKVELLRETLGVTIAYAVKANPDSVVLENIARGLDAFDCASLPEVQHIRNLTFGNAKRILFNNPKFPWGRCDMESSTALGVKHFTIDNMKDLILLASIVDAPDVELMIRLRGIENDMASIPFEKGPGATVDATISMLNTARIMGFRLIGVSFHVGSQNTDLNAYDPFFEVLIDIDRRVVGGLDIVNLGGGLPVNIFNRKLNLQRYLQVLRSKIDNLINCLRVEIIVEPGRAIVADSTALIVPIHRRIDHGNIIELRIPDGPFFSFMDYKFHKWQYPFEAYEKSGEKVEGQLREVTLIGPTCDPSDFVNGVFLPDSIEEGNCLVVPCAGAYMASQRTTFNFVNGDVMPTYVTYYY